MSNGTSEGQGKKDKTYRVYVNTRERLVHAEELTYEEVVGLAFQTPPAGEDIIITVLFHHADQHPADGSLLPGERVQIKNNTSFDVTPTNRS